VSKDKYNRQVVQLLGIKQPRCGLRFGVGEFEPDLTPTLTRTSGQTISNTELDRTASVLCAVDVTFAAEPVGIIWEQGGSVNGTFLGVTDGRLVFRRGFGDGGSPEFEANIRTDAGRFAGQTVKLIAEIIMPDRVRLRVISSGGDLLLYRQSVAVEPFVTVWAGGNAGGIGQQFGGSTVGSESTADRKSVV